MQSIGLPFFSIAKIDPILLECGERSAKDAEMQAFGLPVYLEVTIELIV
jgi:hypothetical protein